MISGSWFWYPLTDKGILFREAEVRVMGRLATGVTGNAAEPRAMKSLVWMFLPQTTSTHVLVVTTEWLRQAHNGMPKITILSKGDTAYGVITLKAYQAKGTRCRRPMHSATPTDIMLISRKGHC